jgi:Flp pilus assembly protein TadB
VDHRENVKNLPHSMRRHREERPKLLTHGERVFLWTYTVLSTLLAPAAVVLVLVGGGSLRIIGIVLLLVALLVMAVPISPFMRARVRRREARTGAGDPPSGWRPQ